MNNIDTVVFTEENCGDKLWQMVGEQVKLLCQSNHIVVVKEEEQGIVVIEYQTANREFGCPYPYWLDSEQYELYCENNVECEGVDYGE